MQLLDPQPANHIVEDPKPDDLHICGGCGTLNVITVLGTREATEDDLNSLTEDERRDVRFAVRAVKQGNQQN